MKNIPPSDMPEVRAKVAALGALSGERKDWGVSRAWERDYLANVRLTAPRKQNAALVFDQQCISRLIYHSALVFIEA